MEKGYIVLNNYRAPDNSRNNLHLFFKQFNAILLQAVKRTDYLFIAGDLNIDFRVESYQKELLVETLRSYGLNSISNLITNHYLYNKPIPIITLPRSSEKFAS